MSRTKEQKAAASRAWHAANLERVHARAKAYRDAHPEKGRAAKRRRLGIVDATGETHEGECPICLRHQNLHCDHDHVTGLVRGWLCLSCNTKLGWLEKPGRAERIRAYLEPHKRSS